MTDNLYIHLASGATVRKTDREAWRDMELYEVIEGELVHGSMVWKEGTKVWLMPEEVGSTTTSSFSPSS